MLIIVLILFVALICFIIYELIIKNRTYYINEKNIQIPILVYHNIVENKSQIEYDYMQTTKEIFEKQIKGLMKLGYVPISYQDLVEYKNGIKAINKRSFLITFDDGYTGVYENAFSLAKKYKIPMASFIINDCVGKKGYYTWEQAKEMNKSNLMHVYLHGLSHKKYNEESAEILEEETEKAYNELSNKLEDNSLLKVFTYPYGLYTEEGCRSLENKGYIQNLTDNKINTSKNLNLSKLHREYPLNDSAFKIFLKTQYRIIRYH